MRRPLFAISVSVCALAALAGQASAQSRLAQSDVLLGRAAVAVRVTVTPSADGSATLELAPRGGAPSASTLTVRGMTLRWASVRVVELARGVRAAVVLASDEPPASPGAIPERGYAAVLGLEGTRPVVLAEGPLALSGDLGERTSLALAIEDFTGDGFADVVVGTRREGVRLCGSQRLPVLAARAIDPATFALRPVALSPLRGLAGREDGITARDGSPGPAGPPVARVLTWESASSRSPARASGVATPLELGDARRETWWSPGAARFAFATARIAEGAGALRAIALTSTPTDPEAARRLRRPRTLWLLTDSGDRLRVTLPGDALLRPDGRYWIVPAQPLSTRCVSLVLDESYGEPAARDVAIAEVEAYTDLDFGAGLDALAARLEEPSAGAAVETLSRAGLRGAEAVVARWPRMGETGRVRALEVLGRIADAARGQQDESAVSAHVVATMRLAFDDPSPLVVERASTHLARLDAGGLSFLAEAVEGADEARAVRAVRALGRSAQPVAASLLLATLGDRRAVVRLAAATATTQLVARTLRATDARPEALRPIVLAIGTPAVAPDAASRVLEALVVHASLRVEAARAIASAWARATAFEDRVRLLRGAARALEVPEARELLRDAAEHGDPWPLRALAVEGLGRSPEIARDADLLTRRLSDRAVRVRVAAVRALAPHAFAEAALVRVLGADRWPAVRAAAAEALGREHLGAAGRAALVGAVEDRSWLVRAVAIRALGPARVREADARVLARVRDPDEQAEVRHAAIALVEARCWVAARATLATLLRERPAIVSDEWVALSVAAWRALLRLGPSPELTRAEGFALGLPRALQEQARRVPRCR